MSQAVDAITVSPALPASPRVLAQSVGSGFVPCIYESGRIKRIPPKSQSDTRSGSVLCRAASVFQSAPHQRGTQATGLRLCPLVGRGRRVDEPQAETIPYPDQSRPHWIRRMG
jgi:hypothetical protein